MDDDRTDARSARPRSAAEPGGAGAVRGQEDHRRPGRAARTAAGRAAVPRAHPRRGRAGPGQDAGGQGARRARSAASSTGSSSPPTWCRPTSSAPASTTSAAASSRSRSGRCSPTCCWPTRSTGRRPRCRARCWRSCRSSRSRSAARPTGCRSPFLVMATQNPIESEGTYPLPEAQVDRFMMKVLVGYPSADRGVRDRRAGASRRPPIEPGHHRPGAADRDAGQVERVYVDPALIEYSVRLANATRRPGRGRAGRPGPLRQLRRQPARLDQPDPGRARARLHPRPRLRACPHDVTDLALDVLRHRLVLSYEALSDDVTADDLLTRVLAALPVPDAPLHRAADP